MVKQKNFSPVVSKNPPKTNTNTQVVPYDPLRAYLREIRQIPKLSVDEEKALAINFLKDGDLQKAYKLVSSNLWLVVKIAREYEKVAKNILDLIQEGNIGLMEAVKNFDPNRGVRLPSYASWWIKAYIIKYILANWRMVKIGTTQAQKKLFFNLSKEKAKLEREGFSATPKLLAEKLNVKESEVIEMQQRLGNSELSVDAPLADDEHSDLHSVLSTQALNAEQLLLRDELDALIKKALTEFAVSINQNQRVILQERLLLDNKKTLQELADQLNISVERVRQIENQVKDKLKTFLKDNYQNIDFE